MIGSKMFGHELSSIFAVPISRGSPDYCLCQSFLLLEHVAAGRWWLVLDW